MMIIPEIALFKGVNFHIHLQSPREHSTKLLMTTVTIFEETLVYLMAVVLRAFFTQKIHPIFTKELLFTSYSHYFKLHHLPLY